MTIPFIKSIISPVQAGRAAAMLHLREMAHTANNGLGQMVVVAGEAGVGKSRLVAELKKDVLQEWSEAVIMEGRCFETDRTLPYAPFIDLLHRAFATRPGHASLAALVTSSALGATAIYLARLLPELAEVAPDLAPPPVLDSEQDKRHLFQEISHLFDQVSAMQPLILVIEDLHWCDDLSLEYLIFLLHRLSDRHILLILTYRDDEIHPSLARFLATSSREPNFTQIILARLTSDEVSEMLRATFGLQTEVPASFLNPVYALTEGNPFFIEEIVRSLVGSGGIEYRREGNREEWVLKPVGELQVPRNVQIAIQQRLEQLDPEVRKLIYMAAVAGRRFDFTLLSRLAHLEEDELLHRIKELVRAQLVVEESDDVFAFRHALTQQAIYFDLLSRERRALHRAAGEATELIYGETRHIDAHLADLVHHFYRARNWEKVARYAPRAGEKAQAFYAPRAAMEYFTRAIEATQELGASLSQTAYHLYRSRANAYDLLGEFGAALDDHMHALDLARSSGDAQEEWQSLLDLGWLWTARDYAMAGTFFQQAITLAQQIGDAARLAQTLNRAGNWHSHAQEPLQARRYHEEALSIFEGLQDRPGIAATLDMLGITSYMGADLVGGVAYYERAITLFRELGDREGLVNSLATFAMRGGSYLLSTTPWVEASIDTCKLEGEEAVQIARDIGWRAGEASALNYIGLNLGFRGEFGLALDCSSRGLRIASEIGHLQWANSAHLALGSIFMDLFDVTSAQRHFKAAHQSANEMGSSFVVMVMAGFFASALIAQGELERAEALLTEATGDDEGMQTIAQRLCWLARGDLALAKEDPGTAVQIADRLVATVPGIEQIEDLVIPRLWLLKARAFMKMQRLDEAEVLLLAARRSARTHDSRPLLWRIEATMCALYRSQGDGEKSEKVLLSARQIINSLAEEIADADLRATFMAGTQRIIGGFTRSKRRETANFPGSLTRREWDVACYIAEGKSNRIIADTLIVSERTIEKHVENMMSKLNFQSRSQIAVWAAQHASAYSDTTTNN